MSRPYISKKVRQQIAEDAQYRCGYCLLVEVLSGVGLTIEHLVPLALGGTNKRNNLWMSCRPCNEQKGTQIEAADPKTGEIFALFNPRVQSWLDHFYWGEDQAFIMGKTPTGRATIDALDLNSQLRISSRRHWIRAGWHPPQDTLE